MAKHTGQEGLVGAALAFALSLAPVAVATTAAAEPAPGAHMTVTGATSAPIGWVDFCKNFPAECRGGPAMPQALTLTAPIWAEIVRINRQVNETIIPVSDREQYGVEERWTFPISGRGDCEDFVIQKKDLLIRAGLPADALLITVVRDRKNDGHAVLTIRTDRGDYILDNESSSIMLWHETGYSFVKRQSQEHPNRWVGLGRPASPPILTSNWR